MANQSISSEGLWALTWKRLKADRLAMFSLGIVVLFLGLLVFSASGFVASDWSKEVGVHYAPPDFVGSQSSYTADELAETDAVPVREIPPENPVDPLKDIIRDLRKEVSKGQPSTETYGIEDPLKTEMDEIRSQQSLEETAVSDDSGRLKTLPFGADKWGHDIIKKTVKGSETSILVGLIAAFVATVLGTFLGAFAGYFGGWIDDFLNWFYNVFTSIPYLLLILAVAAVLQSKGVLTIILILGLTGWTGVFRLVRAEYIKHKEREYVLAANTIGASNWRRMFVHIFPNVSHISLVQMSILSVGFIKSEVILSFLGFGVPVGVVSWGSMLNEAQNELILGKWWQLVAVTISMAILVTALSLFTDGLRDALDPKLKQGDL
ncbi:ABC transporter permease [Oxalobacter formigenes]|uniref:ABC transporter, permease protein n=1 Tax=Oxalobacter formigenes OXCC13 TaxID=556269 RepID=C3XCK5_OXAFO|nr:ABC transporter permease [Oxalobacter formigenes]ARQ44892.1 Dipeptide transport system permease protein DppC [Oxalobacter formigenes]ARQ79125.1 peptide ABC transporter permease [Oxalobacter formigenes OXCC13]EEO30931.1 ABC transporter, permease protein [Oxalobacter formigenes OXCC13]MCZ4062909.1 ABC transporter permease [Oxalobacter formigenes]QDX32247.1 ABC transporter permease [Oxalobacter formigenes]